jgi:hypothetical protein
MGAFTRSGSEFGLFEMAGEPHSPPVRRWTKACSHLHGGVPPLIYRGRVYFRSSGDGAVTCGRRIFLCFDLITGDRIWCFETNGHDDAFMYAVGNTIVHQRDGSHDPADEYVFVDTRHENPTLENQPQLKVPKAENGQTVYVNCAYSFRRCFP